MVIRDLKREFVTDFITPLIQANGLYEGRDYEGTFSGKHDNSILGVANKRSIAWAALWSPPFVKLSFCRYGTEISR